LREEASDTKQTGSGFVQRERNCCDKQEIDCSQRKEYLIKSNFVIQRGRNYYLIIRNRIRQRGWM
jgi:hypothetical protein